MWQLACLVIAAFGLFALKELNPWQRRRAALWNAIRIGDVDTVKHLANTGMNLNFNYNWQFMRMGSPLAFAFHRKDRSISDILIAHGASISPKSPGNEAMLSSAVHGGNFELIDLALSAGHDIHFKPDKQSKPLATAIHHNAISLATFLVSKGASKEDLGPGDCRWHAMRTETILFVHELGIDVPHDVLAAVKDGEWT